jgi:hypothetical protein
MRVKDLVFVPLHRKAPEEPLPTGSIQYPVLIALIIQSQLQSLSLINGDDCWRSFAIIVMMFMRRIGSMWLRRSNTH